jgi:uncharacterized membrane protein YoaK (UPF0700 family)
MSTSIGNTKSTTDSAQGSAHKRRYSRTIQALVILLSFIAGSTDIIGFLGLNGLFTAHITGNLVILATRIVTGAGNQVAAMLSVPVFIVIVSLTRVLSGGLQSKRIESLRPLLFLQFLLLSGFLILCVTAGSHIDASATNSILAGMLGVAAMAVQNALVQISLKDAPPTAAMTSNVTRFAMDVGEALVGTDPALVTESRERALRTLPAIFGFALGCGVGAIYEASAGLWSLALPTGCALLAFFIGFAAKPESAK